MLSVLEQAAAVKERRQAERLAAVEHLASIQAGGALPDPGEIVEATEAAGIDLEAYSRMVEQRERRRTDAATVATRPAFESQRAAAEAAMKAAVAKLEAAQADFNASYPSMEAELRAAQAGIDRCEAARGRLRATKDPGIVARLRAINAEIFELQERPKSLGKRRAYLENELARMEPQEVDMRQRRDHPRLGGPDPSISVVPGDFNAREYGMVQQTISTAKAELPKLDAAIAAVPAATAALEAERESLFGEAERSAV